MHHALQIGATLEEYDERMTEAEFPLWIAYYESFPFGPVADHYQTGLVCSTIFNANPYTKGKALKPADFGMMLEAKKPIEERDDEQVFNFFKAVMRAKNVVEAQKKGK